MLCSGGSRLGYVLRASVVSFIAVSGVLEAVAAGSNTTSPAANPSTPPQVVTSQPQAVLIGDATCSQQLNTIGIVSQGVAVGTDIVGLGLEAGAQLAPTGPVQQGLEASSIGVQVVSKTASAVAYGAQIQASNLPSCEQEFTGTVKVSNGGINVTGSSLFNNNVGIIGSLNASQNVTASQVHATQGISADGGAIWLGDPNGTTYSLGITLGGGALSGAGTGGAQAFTGDVSSIAIGNGASAFSVNSTAVGTGATAGSSGGGGPNATAVGANSSAAFSNSAAFGSNAVATRANQQTFGTASNTYTMPGITSPASRATQTGLLQWPTSDAAGNLATDGGETFKAISRLRAGVAISLSATPPVLANGEKFGMRFGWGTFDGANAVGMSVIGVVGQSVFSKGDRLALDGGVGFGFGNFMGYRENAVVGGRAGMQLTW
jgi:hypothetical protein